MWILFCFLSFQFLVLTNQQLVNNSEQKNVSTVEVLNKTVNNATDQEIMQRNFIVINQTIDNTNKIKKFDDFKPSTEFGGFFDQQSKNFDLPSTKNWSWSKVGENSDETSIESPWRYSKVKFPAPTESRPYPYEKPSVATNPNDLVYQHPAIHPPPPIKPTILPLKQPDSMWNKFLTFTGLNHKLPVSSPKSFFNDYPPLLPDHSSYQFNDFDHNSFHGNSLDHYNQHYNYMEPHRGGLNPWKKILKVLATIIPLGLLLSALTPTIITVSPTNDTETRFNRKDGMVMEQVANSLRSLKKLEQDGCEQKVFCELMVNAMLSKNAEEHIKNLLDNFARRSGISETSFTNVLEAVKNQDCSPLICKDMKDPT